METGNLISIEQFCKYYNVTVSFLNSLSELDLIKITTSQNERYIHEIQIISIEKIIRLHYELDINLEDIDVVYRLLTKVESLQNEIATLQNKLSFYGDN